MPSGDDWLDGLADDWDDDEEPTLDDLLDHSPAPPPPAADLIRCKHCASDRVSPRSTDPDTNRHRFACADCGRNFWITTPNGYHKVYRLG
jgi:hypothetical protein